MIRVLVVLADLLLGGIALVMSFIAGGTYGAGHPGQALALYTGILYVLSAISPPPRPHLTARLEYMPGATR